MTSPILQQIRDADFAVPDDPSLGELTVELTTALGSPDPEARDEVALPILATWIERGTYDDLLPGLGDGLAAGLRSGLGEQGTDTVFRRSFCALVLAECIQRDATARLLPEAKVWEWGDRLVEWYLAERDVRGYVPGKGWAHAVAHGADAIGVLGASPRVGAAELPVLLDVVTERLALPVDGLYDAGEPDRLAAACLRILRRDLVDLPVLEEWVERTVGHAVLREGGDRNPFLASGNAEAFLRALHLQLAVGPHPPACRADLLLVLIDALRRANPAYLATQGRAAAVR